MYGSKAQSLFDSLKKDGIVGAKGEIAFDLLGVKVKISDKSATGNLLQEWLGEWMNFKKINHSSNTNTQSPPDFYLGQHNDSKDWLEVKCFDYVKNPNFDIANFDAYVRDLTNRAFRLDADYLMMGYSLSNGVITINNIWLKKVWEITCPSAKYALRTQVKQKKIVNIRPYNFKAESKGFQPFKDRLEFVTAIKKTLAKSWRSQTKADIWFKTVEQSYKTFSGKSL